MAFKANYGRDRAERARAARGGSSLSEFVKSRPACQRIYRGVEAQNATRLKCLLPCKANMAPPASSGRLRKDTAKVYSGDQKWRAATVKWFNSQKKYGFIQPQGGGKDVFVHISAVERAGLSSLNEEQVIEYEEVANKGKTSAENLKIQR
jgi:cold shock protein